MLLIYILFVTQEGGRLAVFPKFSTIVIFNLCLFSICMIMIKCIKLTNTTKRTFCHNTKYNTEKSNQSIMFISKQKIKKDKGIEKIDIQDLKQNR